MRWLWIRTFLAVAIVVMLASTSAHAPLRWLRTVSGGFRANVELASADARAIGRRVEAAVEGPEMTGTLFAWGGAGDGSTALLVTELTSEIDRLAVPVNAYRTGARIEQSPGEEVAGSAMPTTTSMAGRVMQVITVMSTQPPMWTGGSVGGGVSWRAPEVTGSFTGQGLSTALSQLGSSMDPTLRFGSPYTGGGSSGSVTGTISGLGGGVGAHRPPLVGSGSEGSTVPTVGGSVPEPASAAVLLLGMVGFARRPRR